MNIADFYPTFVEWGQKVYPMKDVGELRKLRKLCKMSLFNV